VLSASRSTRDSQRIHWHLRQRESSDHSAQPHSAPSGLAAQQSENFQRFYRAVISPTHVRVTAGGRIVPNTRATAPPAFDWNGEKFIFEPRKPLPDIESINFQPTPWIHSTPFPAGFPPLIAGSFLSPYNFLPQGNSLNLATMASQSLPDVLNQNHFENAQASKVSVEIAPTPLQSGPGPQQIKISPPHQFDHSKPFMYNGQWVYPVPPGFQPPPNALPLPISMLGNPNLAPQLSAPPVGNFHPPHIPGHITTLSNPLMLPQPHIQPIPMMMHNGAQPLENLPPAVYFPVTSMISVSEITKSQIQGLRNHLKYLDDQLANNKHQIDVSYMEAQRTATMAQIEQMEVMLEAQLAQENKASVEMHRESRKSTEQSQSATPNDGGKKGMAPACTLAMKTPEGSQDASGTQAPIRQTSKTEDVRTGKTGEGLGNAKLSSRSEPAFKSRLSAAAAMAPPFQPRTQAMVVKPPQPEPANGITRPTYRTPTTPDSIETQEQIEARLLSKSSSDWGKPSGVATAPAVGNPCLPKTQSMNETSVQNRNSNQPPTFQRFHTFPGPTFALAPQATVPAISPQAIPYLVGVLPQDMQASDAKATDLIYPRALTEEELHARVLYWGKAPRPAQSGLPKFDGKDFYPPSPVKGVARLAPNPPLIDSIANNQSTVVPLDFDNLFTEPGVPGYKTPSPLRPAISLQNLLPATEQFFLENESTRPPIYGYDSSAFPDWSTQDPNAVSYTPITPPAVNNLTRTTSSQDFSKLFSQRGVPGYKSPSPPRLEINQPRAHFDNENSEMPVTPENVEFPDETEGEDDETRTLDSWGVPTADARWAPKGPEFTPIEPERNDLQSNASTVEIHLTPKIKDGPSKDSSQTSFADRVAKFSR
jgi:hypothetical protein